MALFYCYTWIICKITLFKWNMENHPRKQYNHNCHMALTLVDQLSMWLTDGLTKRARRGSVLGYSSVLPG
jgi:hypothetical protein